MNRFSRSGELTRRDWEQSIQPGDTPSNWAEIYNLFVRHLRLLDVTTTYPATQPIRVTPDTERAGDRIFLGSPAYDWWRKSSLEGNRRLLTTSGAAGLDRLDRANGTGPSVTADAIGSAGSEEERCSILFGAAMHECNPYSDGGHVLKSPPYYPDLFMAIVHQSPRQELNIWHHATKAVLPSTAMKRLIYSHWYVRDWRELVECFAVVVQAVFAEWQLVKVTRQIDSATLSSTGSS
jgi:hypothetical protein